MKNIILRTIVISTTIFLSIFMLIAFNNNQAFALETKYEDYEFNTMTLDKLEVEFDPIYPIGEVSRDIYKYGFDSYGVLIKHLKNLACVRAWGDSSMYVRDKMIQAGPDLLHRLTMKIELNGENAKFYAGEGYWLNVDDNPDNDVEVGTLIHESNCKENDIMAAACYHETGGDGGDTNDTYLGNLIWYYWDTWLDASLGSDKSFIMVRDVKIDPNDTNIGDIEYVGSWFDAMVLSDNTIMDLTHSRYVNRTQLLKNRNIN